MEKISDTGHGCAEAQVTVHLIVAENLERRQSREQFPKNPQMRKGEGSALKLPRRTPRSHLCHFTIFIFFLSPRISRFTSTRASAASPHLDLRDGAEEGSCEPKEGEPKESER